MYKNVQLRGIFKPNNHLKTASDFKRLQPFENRKKIPIFEW
jgi:hypothetical protein